MHTNPRTSYSEIQTVLLGHLISKSIHAEIGSQTTATASPVNLLVAVNYRSDRVLYCVHLFLCWIKKKLDLNYVCETTFAMINRVNLQVWFWKWKNPKWCSAAKLFIECPVARSGKSPRWLDKALLYSQDTYEVGYGMVVLALPS